jgi:hypothetical protein
MKCEGIVYAIWLLWWYAVLRGTTMGTNWWRWRWAVGGGEAAWLRRACGKKVEEKRRAQSPTRHHNSYFSQPPKLPPREGKRATNYLPISHSLPHYCARSTCTVVTTSSHTPNKQVNLQEASGRVLVTRLRWSSRRRLQANIQTEQIRDIQLDIFHHRRLQRSLEWPRLHTTNCRWENIYGWNLNQRASLVPRDCNLVAPMYGLIHPFIKKLVSSQKWDWAITIHL